MIQGYLRVLFLELSVLLHERCCDVLDTVIRATIILEVCWLNPGGNLVDEFIGQTVEGHCLNEWLSCQRLWRLT